MTGGVFVCPEEQFDDAQMLQRVTDRLLIAQGTPGIQTRAGDLACGVQVALTDQGSSTVFQGDCDVAPISRGLVPCHRIFEKPGRLVQTAGHERDDASRVVQSPGLFSDVDRGPG
jgi:hypothetical protein